MRILYHHRTQGEEPESVHINSIVEALRGLGATVDIVGPVRVGGRSSAPSRSLLGRVKDRLPRMAVELLQLGYNLKSFAQLARQLRQARYDFLYERYALYNLAGIWSARWYRLPIILEVNTAYAQAWSKYYGLRFPALARALEKYVFTRADRLITVTDVQRQLLEREGVAPHRIAVSHNAIDPEEFSPQRYDTAEIKKALGLQGVVAGFVGTMNRWQGVQGFAEVIRTVAAQRNDVMFLFVGDGEGRAPLLAELERQGLSSRAVFVGRQPHAAIARYIAAMDIGLLLDSNVYGSPMKVFEYWGMGKAVIAPSVAPVLEIMRHEDTGIVIPPGDASEMARQILRLAADQELRNELGSAGRQYVVANHVWSQNARMILAAYDACCAVDSPPRTAP